MKGEWCYFKQFFTPEICNRILDDAKHLPIEDAKVGVNGELVQSNYRKSKIRFIQKTDSRFEWLFDSMWKMAIRANDEFFGFNITRITYIQLASILFEIILSH